jgi:hypothetical protein
MTYPKGDWRRLIDEDFASELRQRWRDRPPWQPRKEGEYPTRKRAVELWGAKAEREDWAIKWLASKLDDTTKRDDHKADCMGKFGIDARPYRERVWPAARKLAGLIPKSLPGPKQRPKK